LSRLSLKTCKVAFSQDPEKTLSILIPQNLTKVIFFSKIYVKENRSCNKAALNK